MRRTVRDDETVDPLRKRLSIAYVTPQEPLSKRSWSGTQYYMAQALQKHCGDVSYLGPVRDHQLGGKLFNRLTRMVIKKRYDYSHSLSYARKCARYFEQRLESHSFDVIFSPAASSGIAYLRTTIPIIYTSDTTFASLQNYYPEFSDLLERSVLEGNTVEKEALQRARLVLYSSEWAAQSAVSDYSVDRGRIRIIPFGANLDQVPSREAALAGRTSPRCRLLFLAVNWVRKGGDIAFETLRKLVERGVDAELVVCGCVPPSGISHERMTVIPFLSKDDPRQLETLTGLLLASDFLLLPTRYDCTPIVFCEANAFGTPVITTDTGGVSGLIKSGENGFMLPASAGGTEYAETICSVYRDNSRYAELRRSSRAAFEDRLNWDSWAISVSKVIAEII